MIGLMLEDIEGVNRVLRRILWHGLMLLNVLIKSL